jgi:hypothetical protein
MGRALAALIPPASNELAASISAAKIINGFCGNSCTGRFPHALSSLLKRSQGDYLA